MPKPTGTDLHVDTLLSNMGERTMHPSTKVILRYFNYSHLPSSKLRHVSKQFYELAHTMLQKVPEGPETTAGLRKLLEAKDCFVRAALPESQEKLGDTWGKA